MLIARVVLSALSLGLIVLHVGVVSSQTFPIKSIRIVTSSVGGGNDFTARQVAQGISGPLGQTVIVENRPTTLIVGEIVSKAPADGYTLLLNGSTIWVLPLLQKTPYDPVKDFSPITITDQSPDILCAHPSLPATTVKEMIALAKASPGRLNYATGPTGGPPHLKGELLKTMAGINIVNVPYKGGGPALNGLLSGDVQMGFVTPPAAIPNIKSGKLKALGVTSAAPSILVPGVPPIALTLPGYDAVSMTAIFAPAGTPTAAINRLNQEIVRFLRTPEAKERFFNSGVETVGNSSQEIAATMKTDIAKWGKIIKDLGIKAEN